MSIHLIVTNKDTILTPPNKKLNVFLFYFIMIVLKSRTNSLMQTQVASVMVALVLCALHPNSGEE